MSKNRNPRFCGVEALPDDDEYAAAYDIACKSLFDASGEICRDLVPPDVVGAFLTVAMNVAIGTGQRDRLAAILRETANQLDAAAGPGLN